MPLVVDPRLIPRSCAKGLHDFRFSIRISNSLQSINNSTFTQLVLELSLFVDNS